jgi:competence protein ComEA
VNVNRAQIKELEQITGIGPALAGRIVATRQRLGRFERPEDLLRVPGIGPAVLQRITEQVRF